MGWSTPKEVRDSLIEKDALIDEFESRVRQFRKEQIGEQKYPLIV